MKQLFTLLFISIHLYALAQNTFKTRIIAGGESLFSQAVQLNDGSYVCVGFTGGGEVDGNVLVSKLNSNGVIVASKSIGTTGNDEGFSIAKTSDGGFAISGYLNIGMALLKFNADFTLSWKKVYTVQDGSAFGTKLLQTSEGGYILVGGVYNSNNFNAGYIVKTDSKGEVLFSKQYLDFANKLILDIVAMSNNNYAFLATTNYDDNNLDSTYLVKINSDGNIIWSRHIYNGTLKIYPSSLIATSDNNLVLAGSAEAIINYNNTSYTLEQLIMVKFNGDGDLLWSNRIDPSGLKLSYAYAILEDNAGDYVAAGYLETFDDEENIDTSYAYIVKLNTNGTLQSAKTYEPNSNEAYTEFTNVLVTNDGGYAACGEGYLLDGVNDASILYKFDGNFEICGETAGNNGALINFGTSAGEDILVRDIQTTVSDIFVNTIEIGTPIYICSLLPIQLLSFNATLQSKNVNVQWKTVNEVNTSYFVVERSSNTTDFKALQQAKAASNSSSTHTYQITDVQPLFGTSYYRLKQVDKDGSFTYSPIASVTVSANGTMVVSPNPVGNYVNFLLQSATNNKAIIQVTDINGKILSTQQVTFTTGTNKIAVPAASLSKGLYLLKVVQNDKIQAVKFIKE